MGGKKHGKKPTKTGLGRSIVKAGRAARQHQEPISDQHSEPLNAPVGAAHKNLRSITEVDAMAEFLADAEMADREFMAEKQHVVILEKHSFVNTLEEANRQREKLELELGNRLTIPRRPPWNENTTKEELDRTERHSFLEWRRSLAEVEETEGVMMTPFEKNLEVWRQLWRVVEKSDIVVQIIDARDPLLFRSIDLENYVKQVDPNKVNMLLINKADLLTQAQRAQWAEFFKAAGLEFRFWSALTESMPAAGEGEEDDFGDDSLLETDPTHVCNRQELLRQFFKVKPANAAQNGQRLLVGMIGYPNVGKSSTINALCQAKKVAVSSTPGKTKHFQTLLLGDDVCLCDCPGLVFPSFVSTKAEMIVNGLLPIDQMRDQLPPVTLICERIPREVLQETYGIILPLPADHEDPDRAPTSKEFLQTYAYARGFMTAASGLPDEMRAARLVLKDYVNGVKLLHCHPPPGGWKGEAVQMKRVNLKGIPNDEGEEHNDLNSTTVKTTKTSKPATTTPSSSSSTPMTQFQHHTAINAPPKTSDKGRRKSKKKAEPYVEPDEHYRRQTDVVAMTKGVHGQTNFSRNQTPGFSVRTIPVKSAAAKVAPPSAKLSSAKISSAFTSSAPIPTPLSVSSNPTPANSPSLRET